jgi:hypothetical protein
MTISNLRALRLALFALLVCGATVFSARTAHAQWMNPVCADPNDITDSFQNFSFSGNPKCVSICKSTVGALCKSLIRSMASCQQTSMKGYWDVFGHEECDGQATAADRHACNSSVNTDQKDSHDQINTMRDSALSACDDDLAQCIANCTVL